jgi:hypothetical protein
MMLAGVAPAVANSAYHSISRRGRDLPITSNKLLSNGLEETEFDWSAARRYFRAIFVNARPTQNPRLPCLP